MNLPSLLGLTLVLSAAAQPVDHHQHIFSPTAAAHAKLATKQITAADLIRHLDNAGIRRAVVLSVAYSLANPNKAKVPNEYALSALRTTGPPYRSLNIQAASLASAA